MGVAGFVVVLVVRRPFVTRVAGVRLLCTYDSGGLDRLV
jgi:hypothetical protein